MRFLFFDIECANCDHGLGKICSFGYVICDSQFNILEKEDILINPDAKFSYGITCNKFITLGYPLTDFTVQPKFDYFYPKIKEILSYPDQLIIGHAIGNDINFLLGEYERYNLPIIKYNFYDSQELYRLISGNSQSQSLTSICDELNIETGVAHRSDEDSLMTYKIVQNLCQTSSLSLPELFDRYPNCGHTMDNSIMRYNKRKQQLLYNAFIKYALPQNRQRRINDEIKNKIFCCSRKIEGLNLAKMAHIVQIIIDLGGKYTDKVEKCDYFIRTKSRCDRLHKAKNEIRNNNKIEIISFTEFQKMCKIKWSSLSEIDMHEYLKKINKNNIF